MIKTMHIYIYFLGNMQEFDPEIAKALEGDLSSEIDELEDNFVELAKGPVHEESKIINTRMMPAENIAQDSSECFKQFRQRNDYSDSEYTDSGEEAKDSDDVDSGKLN
jgi:hypothetical protein